MQKIKILTLNATQWANALRKAQSWGAFSRDGDTTFNPEKTAMVIVIGKDARGPYIQSSRTDFEPTKSAYSRKYKYGEWMGLQNAPWDFRPKAGDTAPTPDVGTPTMVEPEVVVIGIECEAPSICAQSTLKIDTCEVLAQNDVIFKTQGLPFLQDAGVELVENEGDMYILDTVKNTATKVTAESVAAQAKKDIEAGDMDTPYALYAVRFDLIDGATMKKVVDDAE